MKIKKRVLNDALKVLGKMVCQTSPVELSALSVTLISCIQTEYQLSTAATVTGLTPRAVLTLDREILLRMLLQGYTTFKANSDGLVPVIASGGAGQPVVLLNVSAWRFNHNPDVPDTDFGLIT